MYENPTKELISLEITVQFEISFKALSALRSRECPGTITCFQETGGADMVTVDTAVQRRSSWCDLYKEVTTGILWVNAAQIITRQMTQQRNEESRELVDCLTQVQITSIGIKRLFMGFIKYTFELDTSIFSSSTAVSIWLSAPTLSPLNDEF